MTGLATELEELSDGKAALVGIRLYNTNDNIRNDLLNCSTTVEICVTDKQSAETREKIQEYKSWFF